MVIIYDNEGGAGGAGGSSSVGAQNVFSSRADIPADYPLDTTYTIKSQAPTGTFYIDSDTGQEITQEL